MNICVAPRGVPSATSVYPDLRGVLRPPVPGACPDPVGVLRFSLQLFHCQAIADSLFLLPLFLPKRPFVFNRLRTLLPKTGGWGCLRTAPHYSLSTACYRLLVYPTACMVDTSSGISMRIIVPCPVWLSIS